MKYHVKRIVFITVILIQIICAYIATKQGEINKQAELNHIKLVENYYNLLEMN